MIRIETTNCLDTIAMILANLPIDNIGELRI